MEGRTTGTLQGKPGKPDCFHQWTILLKAREAVDVISPLYLNLLEQVSARDHLVAWQSSHSVEKRVIIAWREE